MTGETIYTYNFVKDRKIPFKKSDLNVSCRLIKNLDDLTPELMLEAYDYDTLWELYTYHISGLARNKNAKDELRLIKHIASKLSKNNRVDENTLIYPDSVDSIYEAFPDMSKDFISRSVKWYEHNEILECCSNHVKVLEILVQPIHVIWNGKGMYTYGYYDDGTIRSPLKVVYQANGREKL